MRSLAPAVAMVLAAGRGRRMRPLSDCLPKPALPLPGGPVIASPLGLAARAGVHRVVVNAWHLADRLEEVLGRMEGRGPALHIAREASLMGTAGGLAAAREAGLLEGDGPLLVVNGDGVLDLELEGVLLRHRDSTDLVTLALLPHPDPERWSRVLLDPEGRVRRIFPPGPPETAEASFVYPGVMVVSREALAMLPAAPGEVPDALWEPARRAGRLGGVATSGHWREVGTPDDYLATVLDHLGGAAVVDPTARVHPSARIGRSLVGRSAEVEAGAVIRESVVAEAVVVSRQARVERSVLLGPLHLAPQQVVGGQVLAVPF